MKNNSRTTAIWLSASLALLLLIWLAIGLSRIVFADDVMARGIAAYRSGKYDQSLEYYRQASIDQPESPYLYFNQGNVYYQKQDYAKAVDAFEKAALKSKDLRLEARATYNLGNCRFAEGKRQEGSDLQKALEAYRKSISHYQKARELDPKLDDAAYNIEIVRLVIKDLLDKIKKQQQKQQKQQQQQQEIAKQLGELIARQGKSLAANDKLAGGTSKGQEQDWQKQVGKLPEEQGSIRTDSAKLGQKMAKMLSQAPKPPKGQQPPPSGNPMAKAKQHVDKAVVEQGIAQKHLAGQHLVKARPNQESALQELQQALAAMQGQGKNNAGQQQKQRQPGPTQKKQAQAAPRNEQARKILEKEKKNQERRQQVAGDGYQEVDKDW